MKNINNNTFKHIRFQSANQFLQQSVIEGLHFMLKEVVRNFKHLCLLKHTII